MSYISNLYNSAASYLQQRDARDPNVKWSPERDLYSTDVATIREDAAKTARELREAELGFDNKELQVNNNGTGAGANYKIKQYHRIADVGLVAISTLASGRDAEGQVPNIFRRLLGGEEATGNEFVDGVLQAIHKEKSDGAQRGLTFQITSVMGTAGNDNINISEDGDIIGARTGDGSDLVKLTGDLVANVYTDKDPAITAWIEKNGVRETSTVVREYANDDFLEVTARAAKGLDTGGGDDVIHATADFLTDVSGGDGNDVMRLRGAQVSDVDGGEGQDRISVQAVVLGEVRGGAGDDSIAVRATTASAGYDGGRGATAPNLEARMRAALTAAEVSGGAGDDDIRIGVQGAVRVSGGAGDDQILAAEGTIALSRQSGDGNDLVELGEGVEVVIDAQPTHVLTRDNRMFLAFGDDGFMVLEGIDKAGAIAFRGPNNELHMLQEPARLNHTA